MKQMMLLVHVYNNKAPWSVLGTRDATKYLNLKGPAVELFPLGSDPPLAESVLLEVPFNGQSWTSFSAKRIHGVIDFGGSWPPVDEGKQCIGAKEPHQFLSKFSCGLTGLRVFKTSTCRLVIIRAVSAQGGRQQKQEVLDSWERMPPSWHTAVYKAKFFLPLVPWQTGR